MALVPYATRLVAAVAPAAAVAAIKDHNFLALRAPCSSDRLYIDAANDKSTRFVHVSYTFRTRFVCKKALVKLRIRVIVFNESLFKENGREIIGLGVSRHTEKHQE